MERSRGYADIEPERAELAVPCRTEKVFPPSLVSLSGPADSAALGGSSPAPQQLCSRPRAVERPPDEAQTEAEHERKEAARKALGGAAPSLAEELAALGDQVSALQKALQEAQRRARSM